jgi:hypothetical protein
MVAILNCLGNNEKKGLYIIGLDPVFFLNIFSAWMNPWIWNPAKEGKL